MKGSRDVEQPVLACIRCGRELAGDPDDEPSGDAGQPLCGECRRTRDFEADLQWADARDGSLDGTIEG